jgi:hypothetical protein
MPATDIDFEREFAELVAQLRDVPAAAPESLRARVRALGEPETPPTLRDRLATLQWRRAVLIIAPACVAVLLSVAVVRGLLSSGASRPQAASSTDVGAVQRGAKKNPNLAPPTYAPTPAWGTSTTEQQLGKGNDGQRGVLAAGAATGDRPVDYDASLRVRVRDADALSDKTADAMRVARAHGGYVASLQQTTTAGRPGESNLVLRVPVAHVEQAMTELAALGTVVEQHLSVVDLQQTLDQQRRLIRNLRFQIARLTEALRNPSLPADVRLRLRFLLEEARQSLTRATRAHKGTLREAALSQVSLSLTTQRAAGAVPKHHQGRLERAARNAVSFLAAAGAVALFLLIAVSPLLVLAAAWLYATRAYRRREERRLLTAAPE